MPVRFLDPLKLEFIDGQNWKVLEEFDYQQDNGFSISVKVPAGFVTDFASIPRGLWNILPPAGPYGKAAVVHDYLYRTRPALCTRSEADGVFLKAMEALGVPGWKRYPMFYAVRTFGGGAFQK